MKTTVTVIALKSVEYQGQFYTPGQSVTMSPIDAVVLSRKRVVTLSKRKAIAPEPVPEVAPEVAPEPLQEAPRARRSYKRRDMQAEQIATLEPEQAQLEPSTDPAQREPYAEDY